jgi:Flp pilus assembly protein TadG
MLAIPFFALIFAIFESCISFAGQQLVANTTDEMARLIRTGQIRTADLASKDLKTRVCEGIEIVVATNCPDLVVDLQTYTKYSDVPTTLPMKGNGDINEGGFKTTIGPAGTIQNLRVFYRWPVYTDILKARLSTMPGNKSLVYASMTWKNEAFD